MSSELALPASIQEKMTEAVFNTFLELFPKEELQEKIEATIQTFFTVKVDAERFERCTRFEQLVWNALSTFIKPTINKTLSEKEEAFRTMMTEQFIGELKQVTNQGVDNIAGLLALSASRVMASEILQQAHASALMGVQQAAQRAQYGGSFADALGSFCSTGMTYQHPWTMNPHSTNRR